MSFDDANLSTIDRAPATSRRYTMSTIVKECQRINVNSFH